MMVETIAISALIGLLAGFTGSWFQSLLKIRESKMELIFNLRIRLYDILHRITFTTNDLDMAIYDWQTNGIDGGQGYFEKEFKKWFKNLKDFYENSSWGIDSSVHEKLVVFYETAEEIMNIFEADKYEDHNSIDERHVDALYSKLMDAGIKVRTSIQQDMKISGIHSWS